MNKKKWIFAIIIAVIFIILGAYAAVRYQEKYFLYMGLGAAAVLFAAIFINIVLPDWLNK